MKMDKLTKLTMEDKIKINFIVLMIAAGLFFVITLLSKNYTQTITIGITGVGVLISHIVLQKANPTIRATVLSIGTFLVIFLTGFLDGRINYMFPFFQCALVLASLFFDAKIIRNELIAVNIATIGSFIFFYDIAYVGQAPVSIFKNIIITDFSGILLLLTVSIATGFINEAKQQAKDLEIALSSNNDTMDKAQQLANEQQSIIEEVYEASNKITTNTQQLYSVSNELNVGIAEQMDSLNNLGSSMQQIAENVSYITNAANEGTLLSNETASIVSTGKQNMNNMLDAMNNLHEVSQKITKVVNDIDNIAFQTNILALNAAVEAARAGAAGKGFAVVADEVRNLATKSAESAKSTNVLMDQITSSINQGITISNEAVDAFNSVVEAENKTQSIMSNISNLATTQKISLDDLTHCASSIETVVNKNKVIVNDVTNLSGNLQVNIDSLQSIVKKSR